MGIISGGQVLSGEADFRLIKASYTFAANGGAVGVINLLSGSDLPQGAIIMGGFLDIVTPPTSGGAATISVGAESAAGVVAAAAISGAPWSTTGIKSVIPAFTGATVVRTTVARNVTITVATAALTAGAFDVYLFIVAP